MVAVNSLVDILLSFLFLSFQSVKKRKRALAFLFSVVGGFGCVRGIPRLLSSWMNLFTCRLKCCIVSIPPFSRCPPFQSRPSPFHWHELHKSKTLLSCNVGASQGILVQVDTRRFSWVLHTAKDGYSISFHPLDLIWYGQF